MMIALGFIIVEDKKMYCRYSIYSHTEDTRALYSKALYKQLLETAPQCSGDEAGLSDIILYNIYLTYSYNRIWHSAHIKKEKNNKKKKEIWFHKHFLYF